MYKRNMYVGSSLAYDCTIFCMFIVYFSLDETFTNHTLQSNSISDVISKLEALASSSKKMEKGKEE